MIKGKGVDCVHFVAAVLADAGIVEPFKRLPSYPLTWGLCAPENVVALGLQKILAVRRLPPSGFQFGDIVIFRAGRQSNHAGIIVDGRLWHVMTGGVVHAGLIARFVKGMQEIVRLTDRGWKAELSSVNLHELLK
jgi:hypothetical protein